MKEITKYYEIDGKHYVVRLLMFEKDRLFDKRYGVKCRLFLTIKPF